MNSSNVPSRFHWHHGRLAVCLIAVAALYWIAHARSAQQATPPVVHVEASLQAAVARPSAGSGQPLAFHLPSASSTWQPTGEVDARIDRFRRDISSAGAERVIPPEQRWRIEFPAGLTIVPYAAQLDALGIELAVVGNGEEIVYVTGVSRENPKIRREKRTQETRFYLTWGRGDLEELDRILLSNAGIDIGNGVIVHFLTDDAQKRLLDYEKKYQKRPLEQIAQTVFKIRKTFRGYELYVAQQKPR